MRWQYNAAATDALLVTDPKRLHNLILAIFPDCRTERHLDTLRACLSNPNVPAEFVTGLDLSDLKKVDLRHVLIGNPAIPSRWWRRCRLPIPGKTSYSTLPLSSDLFGTRTVGLHTFSAMHTNEKFWSTRPPELQLRTKSTETIHCGQPWSSEGRAATREQRWESGSWNQEHSVRRKRNSARPSTRCATTSPKRQLRRTAPESAPPQNHNHELGRLGLDTDRAPASLGRRVLVFADL